MGKELKIDKKFYGENPNQSERLWIEDSDSIVEYTTAPRIGIDYAGEL